MIELFNFIFGSFDVTFKVLCIMIGLNMVSGILSSLYEEKFSFKEQYKKVIKKLGIFLVISIAHMSDMMFDILLVRSTVCLYFSLTEAKFVLEQIKVLGVPVPDMMIEKLDKIQLSKLKSTDKVQDKQVDKK